MDQYLQVQGGSLLGSHRQEKLKEHKVLRGAIDDRGDRSSAHGRSLAAGIGFEGPVICEVQLPRMAVVELKPESGTAAEEVRALLFCQGALWAPTPRASLLDMSLSESL